MPVIVALFVALGVIVCEELGVLVPDEELLTAGVDVPLTVAVRVRDDVPDPLAVSEAVCVGAAVPRVVTALLAEAVRVAEGVCVGMLLALVVCVALALVVGVLLLLGVGVRVCERLIPVGTADADCVPAALLVCVADKELLLLAEALADADCDGVAVGVRPDVTVLVPVCVLEGVTEALAV